MIVVVVRSSIAGRGQGMRLVGSGDNPTGLGLRGLSEADFG